MNINKPSKSAPLFNASSTYLSTIPHPSPPVLRMVDLERKWGWNRNWMIQWIWPCSPGKNTWPTHSMMGEDVFWGLKTAVPGWQARDSRYLEATFYGFGWFLALCFRGSWWSPPKIPVILHLQWQWSIVKRSNMESHMSHVTGAYHPKHGWQ